ncbi:HDOD domain-containing protein [Marinobacterium sp. YM272]|uniref:HDOD domain-containing protein n=1 Tax=Marinobacterium sp. YM272 TaxID=3421654 RepID=UPI003D7FE4D1
MATLVYLDYSKEAPFEPLDFQGWRCRAAADEEALLAQIEDRSVDLLFLRVEGDNLDVLAFARRIARVRPDLVRVIISFAPSARYLTEASEVVEAALPARCDEAQVVNAIERAQQVKDRVFARKFDTVASFLGQVAPLPSQIEGLDALIDQRLSDSAAPVAPLFKGHLGYMKAVMALANNPLFGAKNFLFSLTDAVKLVGLRGFRDLCILAYVQDAFPQPETFDGFSFQAQFERSLVCGKLAEQIARTVGSDRVNTSNACAAGFFLDIGMRALVQLDPQRYFHVMERAAVLKQPIYAIEKLEYNVTQAEVAAHILTHWGISPRTVRAVLYHHVPQASLDNAYTSLTAVHVADAMLQGVKNRAGCSTAGRLSVDYLDQIGELDRRAQWEGLAAQLSAQLK